MEEAWEPAVVSKEFLEKELSKRDWSGRHVRIKFQMVAASLFYWLIKKYEISEINLIFVRFKEIEKPEALETFALLFVWYTIISFLFRSFYEAPIAGEMEQSHYDLLKDLSLQSDELLKSAQEVQKQGLIAYKKRSDFIGNDVQTRILSESSGDIEVSLTRIEANLLDVLKDQSRQLSNIAHKLSEFDGDLKPCRAFQRAAQRSKNHHKDMLRKFLSDDAMTKSEAASASALPNIIAAEAGLVLSVYKWSHWTRSIIGPFDLWLLGVFVPVGFSFFLLMMSSG